MRPQSRMALVGLLVLSAFSLAAAWGRKPPKEETVRVTVRALSASEVMGIFHKFPEIMLAWSAPDTNDTTHVKSQFPFKEVTSAPMARVFPSVRFYSGLDFGRKPSYPYLMAVDGNKRYFMPGGFNYLIAGEDQKVTNGTIIRLARAFVIAATGSEHYTCPEITFLDATRGRYVINTLSYSARLLVRIGGQVEEWYFAVLRGQLDVINRRNEKGLIKEYSLIAVESLPKR
jgi:hypothetical protein